jgi:pyridoxamine 5'-phosphate oxidase
MSQPQPIRQPLAEQALPANPYLLFAGWLAEARDTDTVYEHNAMTLATATVDGRPSARVVLLRGFDEQGFCFYTNYDSRKGEEIAANPWVALVFWWGALGRQVRVEGTIGRLTPAESDAYYQSRSLGSRLGAWVSPQSQVIPDRVFLEEGLRRLEAKYGEQPPPRPSQWGGYRVVPVSIEFWQSAPHRLHDRLRYTLNPDHSWNLERLAP